MDEQPLVSVVMPTYNQAQFIGEAINSVLKQTYRNLELIVIDNFSDDGTEAVIGDIQDERLRYFKFANHGIISASRNHGIEQAQGNYLAFIDSDDIWKPDKLTQQLAALTANPQFALAFTLALVKSDEQRTNNKVRGPKEKDLEGFVYDRLLRFNFILTSSVVVKRAVIGEVGAFDEDPELVAAEDFDLWLRIAREHEVVLVPSIGVIYREHAANTSATNTRLQRALNVIDKHVNNGWTDQKAADRARANFYFHVGWTLIENNAKLARSHFRQAVCLNKSNMKIFCVSCAGIMFTFMPGVFTFIRDRNLDKKFAHRIMNPQNL